MHGLTFKIANAFKLFNDHINQYHFLRVRNRLCTRSIRRLSLGAVRLAFHFILTFPSAADFDAQCFPSLSPCSPTVPSSL